MALSPWPTRCPLTPWTGFHEGLRWLGILWACYDAVATAMEWPTLPGYLEGDDIIQDLAESWTIEEPDAHFEAGYIHSAGRFRVYNAIRKERGQQEQERVFVPIEYVDEAVVEDIEVAAIEGDLVKVFMRRLPRTLREVYYLSVIEEMNVREIGQALGMSKSKAAYLLAEGKQLVEEMVHDGSLADMVPRVGSGAGGHSHERDTADGQDRAECSVD